MTTQKPRFDLPPRPETTAGSPRRVGFEIEFSGITVEEAAAAVQRSLGGELGKGTAAERAVHVEPLGDFNVELDWEYLKRAAAEEAESFLSSEWLERLGHAAAVILPIEVVCPPIEITSLARLEPMVAALRNAGAVGTEDSLLAAYGVHVNAEAPSLDAATLLAHIQAFALLQWWLMDRLDVDLTRRASTFISLYPEAYLQQVLAAGPVSQERIFRDYLEHNATRNRALDLLPLLAELDEVRVCEAVDDPRVKPRPAFHFRLPDCHIERPDWSLAGLWNAWVEVERLAADAGALKKLASAFLDADRPLLGVNRSEWIEYVDRWIADHASV